MNQKKTILNPEIQRSFYPQHQSKQLSTLLSLLYLPYELNSPALHLASSLSPQLRKRSFRQGLNYLKKSGTKPLERCLFISLPGQSRFTYSFTYSARAPDADLPNTAAFLGGLVAQEVIKMITKQYVPIDNYCIFDLIETWTGAL
jgi:NEDD8-activating enzyme E1 regulatory subunit